MNIERPAITPLWHALVESLLLTGRVVAPRGIVCRERLGVRLVLNDSSRNVLVNTVRKPNYRFMVAEWLWMSFGRNDVATIGRYNPRIAGMASDDGVTFAGAYGPAIVAQWDRVRDALRVDPDTRQAVIQIYQPPAGPTKDVPCTLSLQFFIRFGKLELVACMRSSDAWLGIPYDVFNFTRLQAAMAGELGVELGGMTLNLGSSHLYECDWQNAREAISLQPLFGPVSPSLPGRPPAFLELALTGEPQSALVLPVGAAWAGYDRALRAPTSRVALDEMIVYDPIRRPL